MSPSAAAQIPPWPTVGTDAPQILVLARTHLGSHRLPCRVVALLRWKAARFRGLNGFLTKLDYPRMSNVVASHHVKVCEGVQAGDEALFGR
jgi:hypothetical protein